MTVEWKVQFRSCDPWWAADNAHIRDLTPIWDQVPWNENLTERVTTDEGSARDQYNTLAEWERTKSQPIKDVRLFKREIPLPDDGWVDAP